MYKTLQNDCVTVAKTAPSFAILIELWFCSGIIRRRRRRSEKSYFRCHSLPETLLQNRFETSFYTAIIVKKIQNLVIFYTTWAYTLRSPTRAGEGRGNAERR